MAQSRMHDFLSSLGARGRLLAADVSGHSRSAARRLTVEGRRLTSTLNQRASSMTSEQAQRLRRHGLALGLVGAAALGRYLLGATDVAATFLFFPLVIAASTSAGGWSAGAVAALASVVVARLLGSVSPWVSVLFVAEGLALVGIIVALKAVIEERSHTLEAANARIGELHISDRHGRTIELAAQRIEELAPEFAMVLLDRQGQIAEWRTGAERLYGYIAEAVLGSSAAVLFEDATPAAVFKPLLAEASRGSAVRRTRPQRRADGTRFDADIELALTTMQGGEGFVMLIRDLTPEQERQAISAASADAQRALRNEADVAQRQLDALQSVTDPFLNAWPREQLVAELLGRVRAAVHADGIALVLMRGVATPRVFSAPEGLLPEGLADKPAPDLTGSAAARVIVVQNDEARVAEQSLLTWPAGTASLLAVPVIRAGDIEGTIEVVDRRGRRSTEWEIALVQVVAARVAGLTRGHGYADTAVA